MVTHFLTIATILSLLFGGGAGGCRTSQTAKSQDNKSQASPKQEDSPVDKQNPSAHELTIVAEGFHSSITKPFIAVIRDASTYSELAKLEPSLPKLDNDFKNNILVAAFCGERNTGGYSVEISRSQTGEIQVQEKKPGKDMMVAQMITSPFKVVSIAASPAMPVRITFDAAWASSVNTYTITKGAFTVSGGFAGRREEFELSGGIAMMRHKRLVTFRFTFRSKEKGEKVLLEDFATGTIESDAIKIAVLSDGDLIPPPTNGLEANGKLTNHEQNLSLTLVSLPTMVADGYGGGGTIEAMRVVPTL
ncbi:MAG TPA: protease complex subunit PrcB family protein [Pyrinomonadaceae bacterium]|nr:protease complex subunit PrcB family protein [Pyrinomonadaceae bacterium]